MTQAAQSGVEVIPDSALDGSVNDVFDATAARHPSRPAICDGARTLTYAEIAALVAAVAAAIDRIAAGEPGPIAILLHNEVRYAAAMLGALRACRAFVPLDATHPLERNRQIAGHAGAVAVISAGVLAAQARSLFKDWRQVVDLDALEMPDGAVPRDRPRADDIAWIGYTSGSTGRPKGVYQDHRGMLHGLRDIGRITRIGPDDRLALCYSPGLLAGTRMVLCALMYGACSDILPPAVLGAAGLAREIRARKTTLLRVVPTVVRRLAEEIAPGERLDSVRVVGLGGERVDWSDYDLVRRIFPPHTQLDVHISSTEAAAGYVGWIVDEKLRADAPRLPVGRVMADRSVTVIGDDGTPVAPGEIGEFVVSGRYVALGYWRNPELTARVFGTDPSDPRRRVLHTGDMGRIRPDGLFEFTGRKDQQIKLRGQRIEPGEIEAALRACSGVSDAAVIVRRKDKGAAHSLAAYVELQQGIQGMLPRHLQAMLGQRVPRHMVPGFVAIRALPRLPNLKIDRSRLARFDARHAQQVAERTSDPDVLKAIAAFERVLQVKGITADDSLASLGGDSLQAVKIALELERDFGVPIPIELFNPGRSVDGWVRNIAFSRRRQEALDKHLSERAQTAAAAADPSGRAGAIEELMNAGELDAARREALALKAAFPKLRFANTVLDVLKHLPAASADTPAFVDDRESEVQVIRRPGADTVMILFCGADHGIGVSPAAAHRWLGRLPASIVYLRDFKIASYLGGVPDLGPDRAATVAGLRKLVASLGARRVVCAGNSSGVYAALHYALDLDADAALGMAGRVNLTTEFNLFLRSAWQVNRLNKSFRGEMPDLREAWRGRQRPRVLLIYGDASWEDRLHAEYLREVPAVTLLPMQAHGGHNVAAELIRRGHFGTVFDWLMQPDRVSLPAVLAAPARKRARRPS